MLNDATAYKKLITALYESMTPFEDFHTSHLLEKIGDARLVLIGEATHGTKEFYEIRAQITRQLIAEKGFMAVAIEGDWPDAYSVNRYVQGAGLSDDGETALSHFQRFPEWMWNNRSVCKFIKWLRAYNDALPTSAKKVGFYGLDLYSLNRSMCAVINYLEKNDTPAAKEAGIRYACFDHLGQDPQTYGALATRGLKEGCIREVIDQLLILQHHEFDYVTKDHLGSQDDYFYALQNARLVKNAERYYRALFEGSAESWNVRDQHMMETVNTLMTYLETRFNAPAKIVIWAHNSHVGDARATEMSERGEVNIGQLVRENHGQSSYSIGFSTYEGAVAAADQWGQPAEIKTVQPGLPGSYETLFHDLNSPQFLLDLRFHRNLEHLLHPFRLQRAIGVVYRPDTERASHYFFTRLPYQFDSIIHVDRTHAVEPLKRR